MSSSRLVAAAATLASLAGLATAATPAAAAPRTSYVVVLAPSGGCAATREAVTSKYDVRVTTTYDSIFCGFAAKLSTDQLEALRSDSAVDSVTSDSPTNAV